MATTVTYKGQTLTTVDNTTKTLETAGTWMEGDLTLTDVSGGGGGNGYGGDGTWTRPMGYPKLDDMTISGGDVVYMSYIATEELGFCDLSIKRTSGTFTFEIGEINNGVYTAGTSTTYSSDTRVQKYFGSSSGGYKVIRITGSIKEINTTRNAWVSYDGHYRYSGYQGIVEIYGNLPHLTFISFYSVGRIEAAHLGGAVITSLSSAFYNNYSLKSIDTQNWDMSNCTAINYTFANCSSLDFVDVSEWDTAKVTNCQAMFLTAGLSQIDISGWDMSAVTNTTQMFQQTKFTDITIPASLGTISANMFAGDNQHLNYHLLGNTVKTLANTNAFSGYHPEMKIFVPSSLESTYKTSSNWSTYASYIYGE